MKTRERIVQTSLYLFNQEGESHVTTLDIANEMDISPGNLYYHFRGKEQIIEEIFGRFEHSMTDIYSAPIKKTLKVEDNWFYLFVVFEEIYNYRFLYYNLTDITQRYDVIGKRFKQLLHLKLQSAKALCRSLVDAGILKATDSQLEVLANSIVLTITYWMSYNYLQTGNKDSELVLHKGVYQVMSLIAPYLTPETQYFFDESSNLYKQLIESITIKNNKLLSDKIAAVNEKAPAKKKIKTVHS